MSSESAALRVEVVLEADGGPEELDRLARALSRELSDLPACYVDRDVAGPPPDGTRASIPVDPGTLMVVVEHGHLALIGLVHAIQSWLDRRHSASTTPGPTIKVRLGGDAVVLTAGELSTDQRRLLEAFLAAHSDQ